MIKTSWERIIDRLVIEGWPFFFAAIIFYAIPPILVILLHLNLITNPPIQTEFFVEVSYRLIEVLGIMIAILIPFFVYSLQRMSSDRKDSVSLILKASDGYLSEIRIKGTKVSYKGLEPLTQKFKETIEDINTRSSNLLSSIAKRLIVTIIAIVFVMSWIIAVLIIRGHSPTILDFIFVFLPFLVGLWEILLFLLVLVVAMRIYDKEYSDSAKFFLDFQIGYLKSLQDVDENEER